MTFEDGFGLLVSDSESIERERQYLLGHLASGFADTTAITLFSHLHCSGVVEASQRYRRDQETMKSYIIFLLAFHAPTLYNDDNAIGWYFEEVLTNPSLSSEITITDTTNTLSCARLMLHQNNNEHWCKH